eukprot:gnl/MRDRNA2_/MRDRNA2_20958_c0_seq1.p1 gnl/MRDRNA2_/MRDRNA2_20958_c0~~gnl/MRDRNA2_/MRDRNA2_20958_c0_seq1.p1  ORF type:complete len:152 (+),score=29.51 gnl/MRDRNA2_/MRDRNA2_20958_c0_seq1:42-458(+)
MAAKAWRLALDFQLQLEARKFLDIALPTIFRRTGSLNRFVDVLEAVVQRLDGTAVFNGFSSTWLSYSTFCQRPRRKFLFSQPPAVFGRGFLVPLNLVSDKVTTPDAVVGMFAVETGGGFELCILMGNSSTSYRYSGWL